MAETSDKLKFVGHFPRPFALLPNSPAVSVLAALHTLPRSRLLDRFSIAYLSSSFAFYKPVR